MTTRTAFLALAGSALLIACQSTPKPNSDIEAARSALEAARLNPYVMRSANTELERAQAALKRADQAWADGRDEEQARHLAYLATQRVQIAKYLGVQAEADDIMQRASSERDRLRLEARTREAQAATSQARSAQQTAEVALSQAAQQSDRAAQLQRELEQLQARNTQRGMVITLQDVLFDTGQATLKPGAQRVVDQLAAVLQQYPERRVLIEGFTDNVGGDSYNLALSQRRADAFRQALIARGTAPERVEARANGEAYPVAGNDTAAGRQMNRRIEVLFSDAQGRFAAR
jgi:outer membrane protein OmpA-like peptidoglycan-associated protein